MSELKVGDPAPEFTLPDETGKPVSLSDFKGKRVVLFFYPQATTRPAAPRRPAASATSSG